MSADGQWQTINEDGFRLYQQGAYEQAEVAVARGRDDEATPIFQRALEIRQQKLGPDHPAVALLLEKYAPLLRRADRVDEALRLEARAKAIRGRQAEASGG